MKKYLIIAATALVAMCACTKNEVDTAITDNQEISFQVASYVGQTKADEDGTVTNPNTAYASAGHFGTFAWQVAGSTKFTAATTAQKSVFMSNVDIFNNGTETAPVWKAAKKYYWPKTGTITFASYSPLDIYAVQTKNTGTADEPVYTNKPAVTCGDNAQIEIAGWVVNTDEGTQVKDWTEDLMWATVATDKNANEKVYNTISKAEGVPTLFHHALAKVNLKAKVSATPTDAAYSYAVIINNIKIDGILYKGDYTVGATTTTTVDSKDVTSTATGTWDAETDRSGDANIFYQSATFTKGKPYSAPSGIKVLSTTADSYITDYFVLPQELGADAIIDIDYTIVTYDTNNANNIVLVESASTTRKVNNVDTEVTIKSMGLETWEQNKNITYTVTIVPVGPNPDDPKWTEITFDPAVAPWTDASGSENIKF